MNACLFLMAVLVGCTGGPPSSGARDPWLAEDKLQHFSLSFGATAMGYGGARFLLEPDAALVTAGATALGLGIAKELMDVRSGAWFSVKDLVWDAAGVALGLTFAHRME
ncbi:MAG TPA: hypothetical protein VMM12_16860 [Longimicrobiales bacterium]|nr:hypothetical protein [Longimicrobiales bacterium]